MYTDVVDLRDFYETSLGQVATRMVRRRLRQLWPDLTGLTVLGLGYGAPYLRPSVGEAERIIAGMPAESGVLHWPRDGANLATLVDEAELPLQATSVDRVLLIHALECTEQVRPMLAEIWRVLAGGGRLVVVVPNRRGIWARLDRTPFGGGHPYTPAQLSRLLRETAFTPTVSTTALYLPPTTRRMLLSAAGAWESIGERWFTTFAGLVVIEATKQIYARPKPQTAPRRRVVYQPSPSAVMPLSAVHPPILGHNT